MPGLDEMLSLSPEEKHRLHGEHSPTALAAVERLLTAPGPTPVLVLAGEPGCDRTGLLEAAAYGAGQHGQRILVLPLDLDGYEEGMDLIRFAEIQIARRWELDETARTALGTAVSPLPSSLAPSLSAAAVVALLLRLPDPQALARQIFPAEPRQALANLLRLLTLEDRLVLHVVASPQLTDPLRLRLLEAARLRANLYLALSCSLHDTDERVAPDSERLRLELAPLPPGDLLGPAKDLLDDLDLETSDRLQRFLDLAALCGPNVPAEILFHHLELNEEEQEELLDTLDEELVENEAQRLFFDHQYGHPSFPGLLTYSFLSAQVNHAILEPVPVDKRRRLAEELLEFVDRSVPLHTRGMALLRLNLAEHLEDGERRALLNRDLRVWFSEDEVDEMTADFVRGLDANADDPGHLRPDDLLATARETDGRWPPHVRMAFVEAVRQHQAGLTPHGTVRYPLLRASLLRELGRRPEALEEARTGVEKAREVYGPDHTITADAIGMLGVVLRELKQPEEARVHLERALELRRASPPPADDTGSETENDPWAAALATLLSSLGLALYDLGQREAARDELLRALEMHRQAYGEIHPAVASDLRNLAVISRELGDPQQALQYVRPIVDILRQIYGDVHPTTAQALTDVASVLRDLGETEGARLHLEAALQIDQQAYGEAHPQVVADLNNLALIEKELGNEDSARDHFEQALALAEASLGEEHPLTVQLKKAAQA